MGKGLKFCEIWQGRGFFRLIYFLNRKNGLFIRVEETLFVLLRRVIIFIVFGLGHGVVGLLS